MYGIAGAVFPSLCIIKKNHDDQFFWQCRYLRDSGVILFLNKQDVLERKLQEGQRLEKFFEHFSPFDTKEETIEEYIDRARAYIRDLFLVNLFVFFFPWDQHYVVEL
jgi:guanine nucleotide-binding protein subunit alpha, other